MVPLLHPRLVKIARAVKVSAILEKIASIHPDVEVQKTAAERKVVVDAEVFGMAHYTQNSGTKTAAAQNPIVNSATTMADLALSVASFSKLASKGSVEPEERLEEAAHKMATVGAVEGILNTLPGGLSEDAIKLAAEIRALNRAYGVKILGELTD